jgi:hypothetical protein
MERGYIKVWRKLEDSGLLQMPNTLALFIYILMHAMHKDRKVGTSTGVITLKRGQYISGRKALAADLEQSEREIRTSLQRLIDLEIITVETTNRYSVYTIENYNKYQDSDQQNDQQTTTTEANKRPANDQQTTTNKELKNLRTKSKTYSTPSELPAPDCVPAETWEAFLEVRKTIKASNTVQAIKALITQLNKLREQGQDPVAVVEQSIRSSWKDLYAVKGQVKPVQPSRHSGFDNIDYREGVNADGSF